MRRSPAQECTQAGFGDQLGAVLRNSTNVILTPDQLRGRVSAVNSAFVQGGPQLGQFESGVVASMGGAPLSALTGGIGALVLVALIALMPKVREFRLSGAAEDPAPSTPTPVAAS